MGGARELQRYRYRAYGRDKSACLSRQEAHGFSEIEVVWPVFTDCFTRLHDEF